MTEARPFAAQSRWAWTAAMAVLLSPALLGQSRPVPPSPVSQDGAPADSATGDCSASSTDVTCPPAVREAPTTPAISTPPVPGVPNFEQHSLQPAIDGSGVIDLHSASPQRLAYSLGSITSWDSAFLETAGDHTFSTGLQGAAALSLERRRHHLLLQEGFSLLSYQHNGTLLAGLERGSLAADTQISSRWTLATQAGVTYGRDAVRALAPLEVDVVGQTVAPAPGTADLGLRGGTLLTTSGVVEMGYRTSPRSGWNYSLANQYVEDLDVQQITTTARAGYMHLQTRNLTLGAYTEGINQRGTLACTTVGTGGRVQWQADARWTFSASAGPIVGTSSCGQTLSYLTSDDASLRLADHDVLYVSFARRPNLDGVIRDSAFLTSVGGGWTHRFGERFSSTIDYATSSNSYGASSAQRQNYIGGSARLTYGTHVTQEFTARHFWSAGIATLTPDRSVLQTTLWWTSQPKERRTRDTH